MNSKIIAIFLIAGGCFIASGCAVTRDGRVVVTGFPLVLQQGGSRTQHAPPPSARVAVNWQQSCQDPRFVYGNPDVCKQAGWVSSGPKGYYNPKGNFFYLEPVKHAMSGACFAGKNRRVTCWTYQGLPVWYNKSNAEQGWRQYCARYRLCFNAQEWALFEGQYSTSPPHSTLSLEWGK